MKEEQEKTIRLCGFPCMQNNMSNLCCIDCDRHCEYECDGRDNCRIDLK